MFLRLFRKAGSLILNRNDQLTQSFGKPQFDSATLRAELNGVGDQVVPYMTHHRFITKVRDPVQFRIQFYILLHPGCFQCNHRLPDLFIQAILNLVGGDLLVFQFAQQQDATYKGGYSLRI